MAKDRKQPGESKAKPGRKPKIGQAEEQRVLGVVGVGGSLGDAAALIWVSPRTLRLYMQKNPHFCRGVKKAVHTGKISLIEKVGTAESWQAAAWMLERKWGKEYGRKERHEHSGPDGKPIRTQTRHTFDLRNLTDEELAQYRLIVLAANRRAGVPDDPFAGRN